MQFEQFFIQNSWLFLLIFITIPIKGFALWHAARLSQKWWFILLLISSTLGILDLIYILFVARKYKVEARVEPAQ